MVPLPVPPMERLGSVAEYVLEEVSSRIINGTYRPGQRLVEADLTRDLKVSRSSVREAFRRLEINRFVQIEANKGATVATPHRAEIKAIFLVREVISGLGAKVAAERIDMPGNRDIVLDLIRQIREQEARDTPKNHRAENGVFHRAINNMSGMDAIGELLDQYNFPILHMLYFRDLAYDDWRQNLVEHMDIARAVLAGDQIAAEHFARKHMARMVDIAVAIAERLMAEKA